jgi:hypothetical protein
MFNEHSFLVKLYARKINNGEITLIDVPELFNLKEEVTRLT